MSWLDKSIINKYNSNHRYKKRCQSNYTVTQESTEKTQEHAEFVQQLKDSSESTNLWFAEDVSENKLTKLDSTSTDENTILS